jgi:hypothetical protein
MRVERLTKSHILEAVDERSPSVIGQLDSILLAVDLCSTPGYGVAYFHEGKICAAAGIVPMWEGCGEAWAIPTKHIENCKIAIGRHFKNTFHMVAQDLKMRRVQAAVKVGHREAHSLARFVGMTEEGLMKKYGPDGSDYVRYAIWPCL